MRRKWMLGVSAALAAATFSPRLDASIVVYKAGGQPADPTEATVDFNPKTGGWDVTLIALYAPGGETVYEVRGNGGETVDNLFIDVPCWTGGGEDCLPAGSPVTVRVIGDSPAYFNTIHNIEQRGTAETILTEVNGLTDLGRVQVEVIGTIGVDRDITGPIISTTPDHPIRGIVWVEAHRDILGDVLAENGRIGRVVAYRQIGRPERPVAIRAKYHINGIVAATPECEFEGMEVGCGDIYAHIDTHVNGGGGHIKQMIAATFHGTVAAERFQPNMSQINVRLVFTEDFQGEIWFNQTITRPDAYIQLPAGGLTGQIVMNIYNSPGVAWVSPVYLGREDDPNRITLLDRNYAQAASQLGGGSVGVVPFGLHENSCTPPDGGTLAVADPNERRVRLRFYGPIELAKGAPVTIARRAAGSGGGFATVPLSTFNIAVAGRDSNSVDIGPRPGGGFEVGYEYRIEAGPALRCATWQTPAVDWTGDYSVTVSGKVPCTGDTDANGAIDIVDLLRVIVDWGRGAGAEGDVSGDGQVNIADLLLVLGNWGPCS